LGSYRSGESFLVYGRVGDRGFLYDLVRGQGVRIEEPGSRVLAARDGEYGVVALVEIPGEPLRIARFSAGESGFRLVSLKKLSVSGSYVLEGYWVSGSGLLRCCRELERLECR